MSAHTTMKKPEMPRTVSESGNTLRTRAAGEAATVIPRTEFLETAETFLLRADLPGVKAEDVAVQCENGYLSISAKCPPRTSGKRLLRMEFEHRNYQRTFPLSDQMDVSRIEASVADGVLTITIPKSERSKPKRIEVKAR